MIFIKELLPNPSGDDGDNEWIRLINESDAQVAVSNLMIKDESGKIFSLSGIGTIAPGETIELRRSTTKIALNNDGDTVYLIDTNGELIDELSYAQSVVEEEIIVANRFITETPPREVFEGSAMGLGRIDYAPGATPIVVGLSIAIVAGLIVRFVIKKIFTNENQ